MFDFLDQASALALALKSRACCAPGRAHGLLQLVAAARASLTKFIIVDDEPAAPPTRRRRAAASVLQNRDIIRMFEGLVVSDSFLLKNNVRELLLPQAGALCLWLRV